MVRGFAYSATFAIAVVLGGTYIASTGVLSSLLGGDDDDAFAQCREGAVAGDIGGPFTLVNAKGETVTDEDVITQPTLVYFGYTFCPDICPYDTARNYEATALLAERGMSVTPMFISIDPERDTPEVIGSFAENFGPEMVGLTGSPEQVKAASQAYRTYYKKQDGDPEYYLVDHSTFTYLVMPGLGFMDYFRRETTPEEMADRVTCFVDAAKG